jgi:murein DD-endopeptidase MepM/ murein hydrolase activator NlpD
MGVRQAAADHRCRNSRGSGTLRLVSRHTRTAWSRPWSLDARRPRRHRILRRPVLGLALAGAVTLIPIPLGGGGGAPLPVDVANVREEAQPPAPSPAVSAGPTQSPAPSASPGPTAPPPETLTGYVWPLPRGRLTQPYGVTREASRIVDGQPFHDGIDLATFCGDRIVAAHDGRVLAAGRRFDTQIGYRGRLDRYYERIERRKLWPTLPIVVVIDDGNGYRSMYAHFSRLVVKRGQKVKAGQLLGYEGATGNASGCHLHYGLFSPLETQRMGIRPDVARRWKLPRFEIARIDPLLVLPERDRRGRPIAPPTPTEVTGEVSRAAGSGAR